MHVLTKGLFDMLTYPQPTRDFCGGAASAKPPLQSLSLAMAPRAGLLGLCYAKWRTCIFDKHTCLLELYLGI